MTDHDMLLAGLADCRWNYMRGLGDAAEDEERALGWRWLADNRRWPAGLKWRKCGFRLRLGPVRTMAEHGLPLLMFVPAVTATRVAGVGRKESLWLVCDQDDLPRFLEGVAGAIGRVIYRKGW
jgi:hypothetical protein